MSKTELMILGYKVWVIKQEGNGAGQSEFFILYSMIDMPTDLILCVCFSREVFIFRVQ